MRVTVKVRDLRDSLSRYLRLVREGNTVVVLDRGRPVAIVSGVPDTAEVRTTAEHLANLAARGLVALPRSRRRRKLPARLPRRDLSGAVAEDRVDRV